jgi:signal transduction histidine kinase
VRSAHEEALQARRAFRLTHRLLTGGGEVKHVEVRAEFTSTENGAVRSRGTVQDITERVEMEAQLLQQQKMEIVGHLAAGVAHDFNNLLTVINGVADLEANSLPQDDPQREPYETILEAGMRAAALSQQLLAFGRKQIMQPIELSLSDTVERAASMLRRVINPNISIVLRRPRRTGQVFADPTQIDQMLLNLAVNARDAMPDGGTLTMETSDVVVDNEYAELHRSVVPGRYVMIAVSDTGTGMDDKTRERIFEPFFTTKPIGKGSGLGLTTVYGIVKQSGHIWCSSELGKGTTFRVYLPQVSSPTARADPTGSDAALPGSETILVVDDDPGLRPITKRILERFGYTVLLAGSGKEALQLLEAHGGQIHLVLTDIAMPAMTGFELAERLRERMPALPVLFTSGVPEEGVRFLAKPYTAQTLTRKIREALDG